MILSYLVAIDVTVTSPLAVSNVAGAAAEAGASLAKAYQRKLRDTAEACRQEGLVFLPFAMETLGGLHSGAVTQVKQLAAALARCKGSNESEVTSQLFGRLSLALIRVICIITRWVLAQYFSLLRIVLVNLNF